MSLDQVIMGVIDSPEQLFFSLHRKAMQTVQSLVMQT
jgi:hypothetical protein